jgi:AAA domain
MSKKKQPRRAVGAAAEAKPKSKQASDTPDDEAKARSQRTMLIAAELLPRAVRWLWVDRVAFGKLTTIVGPGDVKKSLLAVDIAATITTGRKWPGDEGGQPIPGNVILLQGEDDFRDTTLPRLRAAGTLVTINPITRDGPPYSTIVPQIKLSALGATLKQLEADGFWKTKNLRAVLIDPFNAYDEGRNSHRMGAILQQLANIAAEKQIAIVLVHHFNKTMRRSVNSMIFGSSMIQTKSEIMLAVQPDPDDPSFSIITGQKGKLSAKRAIGLIYGAVTRDVPIEGGGSRPFPVIEWLGNDDRTADEIAIELFEQANETAKTAKERRGGKRQQAVTFLQNLMAPGIALETRTIEVRAREEGILGEKSRLDNCLVLKSAADKLGIRRQYGKWICPDLPAPPAPASTAPTPPEAEPALSASPSLPPPSASMLPKPNSKSVVEAAVERAFERAAKSNGNRSPIAEDELRRIEQGFDPTQ